VVDSRTKKHRKVSNKAFMTGIYGNGKVAFARCCSNENNDSLRDGLDEICKRSKEQKLPPPRIIWVDNCCSNREVIQSTYTKHGYTTAWATERGYQLDKCNQQFPVVALDTKHLLSRVLEECNVKSSLFSDFCTDIHAAFTESTRVISRNGKSYDIHARLLPSKVLLKKLDEVVETAKNNDKLLMEQDRNGYVTLLKKDFNHVYDNQKKHVEFCITDYPTNETADPPNPPLFDKYNEEYNWYTEHKDGNFILRRGTNKNESLHKRLNDLFPEKCGEPLAESITCAYSFHHILRRDFTSDMAGAVGIFNYDAWKLADNTVSSVANLIKSQLNEDDLVNVPPLLKAANKNSFSTIDNSFKYKSSTNSNNDYDKTIKTKIRDNSRNITLDVLNKRQLAIQNIKTNGKNAQINDDSKQRNRFDKLDSTIIEIVNKNKVDGKINWNDVERNYSEVTSNTICKANLKSFHQAAVNRLSNNNSAITKGHRNNSNNSSNSSNSNNITSNITSNNNSSNSHHNNISDNDGTNDIDDIYMDIDDNNDTNDNDNNDDISSTNNDNSNNNNNNTPLIEPSSNNTQFTEDENNLLLSLVDRNYTQRNKNVKWETLAFLYNKEALNILNKPNNSQVLYRRHYSKLEQRYKDIHKSKKRKRD
jgi:hypothetical protein